MLGAKKRSTRPDRVPARLIRHGLRNFLIGLAKKRCLRRNLLDDKLRVMVGDVSGGVARGIDVGRSSERVVVRGLDGRDRLAYEFTQEHSGIRWRELLGNPGEAHRLDSPGKVEELIIDTSAQRDNRYRVYQDPITSAWMVENVADSRTRGWRARLPLGPNRQREYATKDLRLEVGGLLVYGDAPVDGHSSPIRRITAIMRQGEDSSLTESLRRSSIIQEFEGAMPKRVHP